MLNSIVLKLLHDSGKISLPTIGIFVKVDMEDETAYLFTPSAVKVDARMVDAVMSEMDVPNDEAVNIITSYVEFIKNIISKNGKYPFKGVGDIMINEQGGYYFVPVGTDQQPVVKLEESVKIEIEKESVQEVIEKPVVESVIESISESIVEPTIEEPVANEEEPKQQQVVEEVKEEIRLNERFQPRRLGEIMEGGANKRFYDKVHSQVIAQSVDDIIKESVVLEKGIEEAKELISEPVRIVEEVKADQEIKSETQPVQPAASVEPVFVQSTQHELSQEALRDILGHSKRKGLHDIYDKGGYMEKGATKPTPIQQPPVFVQQQVRVVTPPLSVETQQTAPQFEPVVQSKPTKKKFDFVLFISFLVIVIGLCVIAYFYYMQQELGL